MERDLEKGTNGGPGSPSVFISYARVASQQHARALHEKLSALGEQTFLDEADLKPGEHFPPLLVEALLSSRVIVIFASEAYFQRWYCQWELDAMLSPFLALGEDLELSPVLVVLPPEGEAVPELSALPPLLRNSNWLRAGDTEGLVALVRERLAAQPRTLAERLEATGQSSTQLRSRLLEEVDLLSPASLTRVRCYPPEHPPSLGPSFVGRAVDLWRIYRALSTRHNQPGEAAALAVAVTGGEGFGKTRLVLEYLHRFGPRHYPGGLFWVNADVPEDRLEEQFHGILCTLKPEVPELVAFRKSGRNAAAEMARALEEVAREQRVLYVVDNVPELGPDEVPRPLRTWCPALGTVSLLLTSRASLNVGTEGVQELPLAPLSPEAAVTLLTDGMGRKGLAESDWSLLAQWVGFLPLALELLNRALRAGVRPEHLLSRARDEGPVQGVEEQLKVLRRQVGTGALRGLAEALSLSYERLSEEERRAARLLAWLAPEPIPWKLLEALGPEVSSEEVYTTLLSRHLVTPVGKDSGRMFGVMHRVLADYLRTRSARPLGELKQLCAGLNQLMEPSAVQNPKTWPVLDACRPHAEQVFHRLLREEARSAVVETMKLGLGLGLFLLAKGAAKQAQGVNEKVVELAFKQLGPKHPDTLTAMHNLALTLQAQGNLSGARAYQEQVLGGWRRLLGRRKRTLKEQHPDTLRAMNNLAETLRAQGDLSGARAYQEQVLEVWKQVLGEEHLDTLTAMDNLATTLVDEGNLGGARAYQEQVVRGRKRVLGEEHPDTLRAMNNLAETLRAQGDLQGAHGYQQRVLEVCRRVLGEQHPDTWRVMNNLAVTLRTQGDLQGARGYQERVLEVSRRVQGEEHPDTLMAMSNLAETLSAQGDLSGARAYQERVLEVRKRMLGEEHPDTLWTLGNLAATLLAQGDMSGARGYQERVLQVSERVLGAEHPDTLRAMNNLAGTLYAQGELTGARGYQERVLAVWKRVLGEEHPDTLTVMNNLAGTLYAQGDLEAARSYQERVLAVWTRVLGEEHPNTLTAMNNVAEMLRAQGDLEGARGYQERVLAVCLRVLGKEQPTTLMAMHNLAMTLFAQGDLKGARGYQERVVEASQRVLGAEHPDTRLALVSLLETLRAQGDLPALRGYQERFLELNRRVLGAEHPDTLRAMHNLGATLREQGDLKGARGYQERALEGWRRVLGAEHPDTLTAMNNLALTLLDQGDLSGARGYQERVLEVRKRVLGAEHPDTLAAMNNLATTLYVQADLEGAREYLEHVLAVYQRTLGAQHPSTLTARRNLEVLLEARRRHLEVEQPHQGL